MGQETPAGDREPLAGDFCCVATSGITRLRDRSQKAKSRCKIASGLAKPRKPERSLLASLLYRWLAHPLTAGRDLDDPATTQLRKQIVQTKPFLRTIYNEWYSTIAAQLPTVEGPVLELGSGAGHCAEFIPGLITSEIFLCPAV